jgi:glycosyltransferase involved in cell wall biosynthesis
VKVVLSNPSVAPHIRQTVGAYHEAGSLAKFYTTFIEHPDYRLSTFLKCFPLLRKDILRRSFHNVNIDKVETRALPELLRSISARKWSPVLTDFIWEWAELGFDRWVARKLSPSDDVVHTYEHAALSTLQRAKSMKMFTVYEQSSAHHTHFMRMFSEQMTLYPELINPELILKTNNLATRRNSRRDQELQLADLILCNSTFTRDTLLNSGIEPQKVVTIPLAFPAVEISTVEKQQDGPVIFLHAGNQSVTKGSHILYQAWNNCSFSNGEAELWLIGRNALPENFRKRLSGKVIIRSNIPHMELMSLYQRTHVLVMPTLADGFGMVITEAMSRGVPVIASTNCCGPDLITSGKDGWIVAAGDCVALEARLKWCVKHKAELPLAGRAAQEKAGQWQWLDFRLRLVELVTKEWEMARL